MQKTIVVWTVVLVALIFSSPSAFAKVNSGFAVDNTDNGDGTGTLVIYVRAGEASANIGRIHNYSGTVDVGTNLKDRMIGSPSFANRRFGDSNPYYTVSESYSAGVLSFSYTYNGTYDGDGVPDQAWAITSGPDVIVEITINYNRAGVTSDLTWTSYSVQYGKTMSGDDVIYTQGQDATGTYTGTTVSLPVELSVFTATYTRDVGVEVAWRTESETNCQGFHVWRSDAEDADYAQITSAMIPGRGDSPNAHDYTFTDRNVNEGTSYWYKLQQVDFDGAQEFFGPIIAQSEEATVGLVPDHYALLQNFPNPFNPATQITYDLPEESSVVLRVYNLLGEEVRTLVNEAQPAGSHVVTWDGRADDGLRLGTGVYFYKLTAGDYIKVRKMVKVE